MHLSFSDFLLFLVLCTSQLSTCGQLYNQFYKEIAVNGITFPGGQLGVIKYGNNESCVAKDSMPYTGLWDFAETFCNFKKQKLVDDIRYIVIRPLSSGIPCKVPNEENLMPTDSLIFEQIDTALRVVPALPGLCMLLLILHVIARIFAENTGPTNILLLAALIIYLVSKIMLLILVVMMHLYSNRYYDRSGDILPKSLMNGQIYSYATLYVQVIIELCVCIYAIVSLVIRTPKKHMDEFSDNLIA
jgi:hypothetical protein